MKKKKEANRGVKRQDSKEDSLSRRSAIKRIAAIFAGAAVGTKALGQVPNYLSNAYVVYSSYYASYTSYSKYISYYSSYKSHYTSVPPP